MKVVVVGATGNVGTSLIDSLGRDDRIKQILGIARRRPRRSEPKTTWLAADMAIDDLPPQLRGADVVVHLGWIFQPTHDPVRTWRTNVLGSMRVVAAVADADVPALVYASSVGAYSPGPDDRPVRESWPTHALPTAAYGREKSYVERVLDVFERDRPAVRVVRMRPGFIFKRESAAEQRRLFGGPLMLNVLGRRSVIPAVPSVSGLRFQALHSRDAADAFHRAVVEDVRGAFNLAADPVVDPRALARLLDARIVRLPRPLLRAAVSATWHLRAAPASPTLVDLFLSLPLLDASKARSELGWQPQYSALDAIEAFLAGLREGAGRDTPPLRTDAGGRLRWREFATGVGGRDHLGTG
jgi:UDP-glucose 4-epimerase